MLLFGGLGEGVRLNDTWKGCTGPSITTQPSSQVVASGTAATLSVTASGSTPVDYQWYQGVSGDTSTPVGGNSSTYTTPGLTTATMYWVRVTNSCGQADSNTALITIGTGGPTVALIKSKSSKPGSTASIRGTGFSADARKDVVSFGTRKATVKKATSTKLDVTIPKKCKKGVVDVRVIANGVASNTVAFTIK